MKSPVSKGYNKSRCSTKELQILNPLITRHTAKQPNYPEREYILSPELVADITEYALNKPGFVYAAMDMPCVQSVTVLQLMSGNHQRKVTSQGSLTGALDSQTMLNRFFFFFS